jgi:hypothetical protein
MQTSKNLIKKVPVAQKASQNAPEGTNLISID